jgi:hypothetical protein
MKTFSKVLLLLFAGFLAGLTAQGVLSGLSPSGLSQYTTSSTKSKAEQSKEDSRKIYPCVIAEYPNGWGNVFLAFLFSVLKNARYNTNIKISPKINEPPVFPCVRGYGEVFGKLFRNVRQCPLDDPIHDCYIPGSVGPGGWGRIREFVWGELPKFPSLMELNATFVEEVFASVGAPFTLNELRNSSCAVHVRFGDAYFRPESTWNNRRDDKKPDRRSCKDNTTASSCFAEVADRVRGKCPDPLVPIYLATDVPQFTQYFCSAERATNNRRFLSSCEKTKNKHINDVKLVDRNTLKVNDDAMPALFSMLSEWLALAFAKEMSRLTSSTFSETAAFKFSV